jgi:hypothetical protein
VSEQAPGQPERKKKKKTREGRGERAVQSDMDKHSRVLGLNRPLGVSIMMEGGFMGYSGGNLSLP